MSAYIRWPDGGFWLRSWRRGSTWGKSPGLFCCAQQSIGAEVPRPGGRFFLGSWRRAWRRYRRDGVEIEVEVAAATACAGGDVLVAIGVDARVEIAVAVAVNVGRDLDVEVDGGASASAGTSASASAGMVRSRPRIQGASTRFHHVSRMLSLEPRGLTLGRRWAWCSKEVTSAITGGAAAQGLQALLATLVGEI